MSGDNDDIANSTLGGLGYALAEILKRISKTGNTVDDSMDNPFNLAVRGISAAFINDLRANSQYDLAAYSPFVKDDLPSTGTLNSCDIPHTFLQRDFDSFAFAEHFKAKYCSEETAREDAAKLPRSSEYFDNYLYPFLQAYASGNNVNFIPARDCGSQQLQLFGYGRWGSNAFGFLKSLGRFNMNYMAGAASATDNFYKRNFPGLNSLFHSFVDPFFARSRAHYNPYGGSHSPKNQTSHTAAKKDYSSCQQTSSPSLCAHNGVGAAPNNHGCVKNAKLNPHTGKCSCAANGYSYSNKGSANANGNRSCGAAMKVASVPSSKSTPSLPKNSWDSKKTLADKIKDQQKADYDKNFPPLPSKPTNAWNSDKSLADKIKDQQKADYDKNFPPLPSKPTNAWKSDKSLADKIKDQQKADYDKNFPPLGSSK